MSERVSAAVERCAKKNKSFLHMFDMTACVKVGGRVLTDLHEEKWNSLAGLFRSARTLE